MGRTVRAWSETTLDSGELIVAVRFPMDQRRLFFQKVGTRQAQAIAKVVIAVSLEPARIAIGSVAEIPIRARQAEEALERGDRDGALEAVASAIRPIDDVRSTADYRRRVTRNVLRRILRTGLSS